MVLFHMLEAAVLELLPAVPSCALEEEEEKRTGPPLVKVRVSYERES
jgi:hypothetical protein